MKVGDLIRRKDLREYYKILFDDVMLLDMRVIVIEQQFVQRPKRLAITHSALDELYQLYNGEDF